MQSTTSSATPPLTTPRRTPRGWRFRLAALVLGAGFAFGLLESLALLNLVDYRFMFKSVWRKPWENPLNRFDSELRFIHRPHDRFVGERAGDLVDWFGIPTTRTYPVDVQYDADGFRNPRELDAADIVLVGDSFAEAAILPQNRIGSSVLADGLGVVVLNLGQSGWGPQQERVALQRYGFKRRPKVVIWVMFEGNDVADYATYERYLRNPQDYYNTVFGYRKRSLLRNLWVAAREQFKAARAAPDLASKRCGRVRSIDPDGDARMYFDGEAAPFSGDTLRALEGAQAVIADAARQCADLGIRFLLVLAPLKLRVYQDLCDFAPVSAVATWRLNDFPQRMADWSARANVPLLDALPALHAAAAAGRLVHLLDDVHWSALGHAVVANEIAERIRREHWLDHPAASNRAAASGGLMK